MGTCAGPRNSIKLAAPCQHIHKAPRALAPGQEIQSNKMAAARQSVGQNGHFRWAKTFNQTKWQHLASTFTLLRHRPHLRGSDWALALNQEIQSNNIAPCVASTSTLQGKATTCVGQNGHLRWAKKFNQTGSTLPAHSQSSNLRWSDWALAPGQEIQSNKMAAPCQHIHTAKRKPQPAWVRLGTYAKS